VTFDPQLAASIQQQGATLLTNTQVQQLQPASHAYEDHRLLLSSGPTVLAKHLFIAAGRLPFLSTSPPRVCYRGFKAHFTGIELNTLEMFSFPGAYLGLVPVEGGRVNLACLVQLKKINPLPFPQPIMQYLIDSHPHLRQLLETGHNLLGDWMEAPVPEFGLKSTPNWLKTYFIGDAAGTIPPACGNGLSLAIASGYLAAEFAIRGDAPGFKRMWQKCCASPLFFGKGLHHLFLHPFLGNWGMQASEWFPFLAKKIFDLTRVKHLK
jgi:flavin-dependent dehydrogenase